MVEEDALSGEAEPDDAFRLGVRAFTWPISRVVKEIFC